MTRFPKTLRHGSGTPLTLDPTHLLLAFKQPIKRDKVEALLKELDLELEDGLGESPGRFTTPTAATNGGAHKGGPRLPALPVNHTDERFWVRSHHGETITEKQFEALETGHAEIVDWLGPVYRIGDVTGLGGLLCPIPNALLVRPAPGVAGRTTDLATVMAQYKLTEEPRRSKHLSPYSYFVMKVAPGHHAPAYELQDRLLAEKGIVAEAELENMPMLVPLATTPNDPLYPQQWDMARIQAGGAGTTGWDITTGDALVTVCILDSGVDRNHPDLAGAFAGPGIDLGDMSPDGSPNGNDAIVSPHGTCCAGIVAARYANALGVSGVAGTCRILPVAFRNWTDVEVAMGINFATASGARVISMSFGQYAPADNRGPSGWNFAIIDPAIQNAFNAGVVLCAATGNENIPLDRYPARNPLVIACGASDQNDNRKTTTSPDGEWWGSNYGPELSVVAPGVRIPTTDRQGTDGYNSATGTAGDYFLTFNGTSSATPHVAGLAALVLSQYPTLTNVGVRNIIERTAEKVGALAYASDPAFPNGTRNSQMGYGRINVLRALDFADVMIRDYPADAGAEPSSPPAGVFWEFSDIVMRIFNDGVFVPGDPSQSQYVERGQPNFLYVRVKNNGVREARNVVVDARITPWVGLQFVYPQDWNDVDAMHVRPAPIQASFASVPAGASVIARFRVSALQVEKLWGWTASMPWHPCLLAQVTADNDFAFANADTSGGGLVVRRNNLAQRNLTVINVLPDRIGRFPFVAGNRFSRDRLMQVEVKRAGLPRGAEVMLELDADPDIFPGLAKLASLEAGVAMRELVPQALEAAGMEKTGADGGTTAQVVGPVTTEDVLAADGGTDQVVFLDRTRLETRLSGYRGVLTLEAGSRFEFQPSRAVGRVSVEGGELVHRGSRRVVLVRDDTAVITMEKQPGQIHPMLLRVQVPGDAKLGESFTIRVVQRDSHGQIVGGASVLLRVGVPAPRPLTRMIPGVEAEGAGPFAESGGMAGLHEEEEELVTSGGGSERSRGAAHRRTRGKAD